MTSHLSSFTVDYTNWQQERAMRRIVPKEVYWGATEWHPEKQWLVRVYDCDKELERDFALADIHSWEQPECISHRKRNLQVMREGKSDEARLVFDQLCQFGFGKFMLEHGGLNGYWTNYMQQGGNPSTELERWVMRQSPSILAAQERFALYKEVLQGEVGEDSVLASVPCGLMAELLELDLPPGAELVGIDLDPDSICKACEIAVDRGIQEQTRFRLQDAWAMDAASEFSHMTSNGLSVYEPDGGRVVDLYRKFYRSLRPGGLLLASFVTPQTVADEWQKFLFLEVMEIEWKAFRTHEETERQLRAAGFENITFVPGSRGLNPTAFARK